MGVKRVVLVVSDHFKGFEPLDCLVEKIKGLGDLNGKGQQRGPCGSWELPMESKGFWERTPLLPSVYQRGSGKKQGSPKGREMITRDLDLLQRPFVWGWGFFERGRSSLVGSPQMRFRVVSLQALKHGTQCGAGEKGGARSSLVWESLGVEKTPEWCK